MSASMMGPNTRVLHSSEHLEVVSVKKPHQVDIVATGTGRVASARSKKLLRLIDENLTWTTDTQHLRGAIQV